MEQKRKIELVGRKISFAEAEEADDVYWANASVEERLAETERLRRAVWTFRLGTYPQCMEKVGKIISRNEQEDGDDF
ncbi:MAG: hypothetical protein ABI861_09235 [Panacibacter sp.]